MKVVVDRHIPYIEGVLEPYCEVLYLEASSIDACSLADAQALLVRTRTRCDAQLLEGSPIEFIGSATIGADHIDVDYCQRRGIHVATAPGCNAAAVQQWTMAALLRWAEHKQLALSDITLGIVGVGHVGSRVELAAKLLGINVLRCDPPRQKVEPDAHFVALNEVLHRSDVLSLHVPLLRRGPHSTYHLLNSSNIHMCRPNALIINSSRGEVAATDALLAFAQANPQSELALDVWEHEPCISHVLLERSFIATPHIAGYSIEGKRSGTRMVVAALSQHFGLGIPIGALLPAVPLMQLPPVASLRGAISTSYSIMADDLRCACAPFEELRNTYTYRHDFRGFVANPMSPCYDDLLRLGFSAAP